MIETIPKRTEGLFINLSLLNFINGSIQKSINKLSQMNIACFITVYTCGREGPHSVCKLLEGGKPRC